MIGTVLGLAIGLWLALSADRLGAARSLYQGAQLDAARDPGADLRGVVRARHLVKVALGVTLVFFIVFFNVYQGVREVSPIVLANARILGASDRQLLRHVYLPCAMSWVFASLHNSVGLAFVGAVVGEYLGSAAASAT